MAREWVIRGVPPGLSRDMWWMTAAEDVPPPPPPGQRVRGLGETGGRAGALVVLVALADWLFFGHALGLSLALFSAAVLGVVMLVSPGRELLRPALLLLVTALPVVEHVQALSLVFLGLGLLVSLVWASAGREALAGRAFRLVQELPLRGVRDGIGLGSQVVKSEVLRDHRRHLRGWAFPLGGALVLSALLIEANPVLGELALRLARLDIGVETVERLLFWTGAVLLVTFVALSRMYRGMHHPLDVAGGVLVGIGAILLLLYAPPYVTLPSSRSNENREARSLRWNPRDSTPT